jgi:enterochelin esterase-like enzyme
MGGGQALNSGFGHPESFGWIGAFSPAPNTREPEELLRDLLRDQDGPRRQFKLLYLSCGNRDGLINVSQELHAYLKRHDIPHVWNVDDHGHDGDSWANNLHHFAQRIFR